MAHPNCMIGRLPCTCGHDGLDAQWHMQPCEIAVFYLDSLKAPES